MWSVHARPLNSSSSGTVDELLRPHLPTTPALRSVTLYGGRPELRVACRPARESATQCRARGRRRPPRARRSRASRLVPMIHLHGGLPQNEHSPKRNPTSAAEHPTCGEVHSVQLVEASCLGVPRPSPRRDENRPTKQNRPPVGRLVFARTGAEAAIGKEPLCEHSRSRGRRQRASRAPGEDVRIGPRLLPPPATG